MNSMETGLTKQQQQRQQDAQDDLDQNLYLDRACDVIAKHKFSMQRSMASVETEPLNKAMAAVLQSAVAIVAELKTTQLRSSNYYEVFNAVIDALNDFEHFVTDEFTHAAAAAKATASVSNGNSSTNAPLPLVVRLYEQVQHTSQLLPRLYLLITVAGVYINLEPALSKSICYDLLSLCKAVQHPMHGLFLRHYLLSTIKGKLPDAGNCYCSESSQPSDSVDLILINLNEMTKLWSRMQQQQNNNRSSSSRQKREAERRALQQLIGTNLTRLSDLSVIDSHMYATNVLPRILTLIIGETQQPQQSQQQQQQQQQSASFPVPVKDAIAQQYLMDVLIQVFPADYHLLTLSSYLSTLLSLERAVDVKALLVALMNHIASFAAGVQQQQQHQQHSSSAATASPEATVDAASFVIDDAADALDGIVDVTLDNNDHAHNNINSIKQANGNSDSGSNSSSYIKATQLLRDSDLFSVFFKNVNSIVNAANSNSNSNNSSGSRQSSSNNLNSSSKSKHQMKDLLGMFVALLNFSSNLYPDNTSNIDAIHQAAAELMDAYSSSTSSNHNNSNGSSNNDNNSNNSSNFGLDADAVQQAVLLLTVPMATATLPVLLQFTHFTRLLQHLPAQQRKSIALRVVQCVTDDNSGSSSSLSSVEAVERVLSYVTVLMRDDNRQQQISQQQQQEQRDAFDVEQTQVCGLLRRIHSSDNQQQLLLLTTVRRQCGHGGPARIRYTFPTIVYMSLQLLQRVSADVLATATAAADDADIEHINSSLSASAALTKKLLLFVAEAIRFLVAKHPELAIRLYSHACTVVNAISSTQQQHHIHSNSSCSSIISDLSNSVSDMMAQCFLVYEDDIADSRTQVATLTLLIHALPSLQQSLTVDAYEALSSKATQQSAKLLRKADQCKAVLACAKLFWAPTVAIDEAVKTEAAAAAVDEATEGESAEAGAAAVASEAAIVAPAAVVATRRDDKRILACLQRSLKIANACSDDDGQQQLLLLLDILCSYLWFYAQHCSTIQVKYLIGLMQVIEEQITSGNISREQQQVVQQYYNNVKQHVRHKQQQHDDIEARRWLDITTVRPTH